MTCSSDGGWKRAQWEHSWAYSSMARRLIVSNTPKLSWFHRKVEEPDSWWLRLLLSKRLYCNVTMRSLRYDCAWSFRTYYMNRIFNICPINPGDPISLNQSDLKSVHVDRAFSPKPGRSPSECLSPRLVFLFACRTEILNNQINSITLCNVSHWGTQSNQ